MEGLALRSHTIAQLQIEHVDEEGALEHVGSLLFGRLESKRHTLLAATQRALEKRDGSARRWSHPYDLSLIHI